MRGAQRASYGGGLCDGIIPAYAGSTPPSKASRTPRTDHPRVCGEHGLFQPVFDLLPGSSPRMRGARLPGRRRRRGRRIIPAYAGSTDRPGMPLPSRWDHPRVCGEHHRVGAEKERKAGSSPRMRGAHLKKALKDPRYGIIPAYAGSTRTMTQHGTNPWDHPRVCGEHSPLGSTLLSHLGSSPRMRGAHSIA